MNSDKIIENNKNYWNEHADLWFGTTALIVSVHLQMIIIMMAGLYHCWS